MIHHAAELNDEGTRFLLSLSGEPNLLDSDPEVLQGMYNPVDQMYFPGISVPAIEELTRPFLVPLIGDYESFSITIDWPQKSAAPFHKRVSYIGMLAAEAVYYERPTIEQSEDDSVDKELNNSFDDMLGFGGFLRTVVEVVAVPKPDRFEFDYKSLAEFYLFEDEAEFDKIQKILKSGFYSASEIVAAVRVPELTIIIEEN